MFPHQSCVAERVVSPFLLFGSKTGVWGSRDAEQAGKRPRPQNLRRPSHVSTW